MLNLSDEAVFLTPRLRNAKNLSRSEFDQALYDAVFVLHSINRTVSRTLKGGLIREAQFWPFLVASIQWANEVIGILELICEGKT